MQEVTDLLPRIFLPDYGGCVRVEVVLLGYPKQKRIIWIGRLEWQISESMLRNQSHAHFSRSCGTVLNRPLGQSAL